MTLRRRRAQAYPLSTFRFPAIRDRNLSQVADDAALPLLCQAKNLSLAQLFRMLESGARFGERLRQLIPRVMGCDRHAPTFACRLM